MKCTSTSNYEIKVHEREYLATNGLFNQAAVQRKMPVRYEKLAESHDMTMAIQKPGIIFLRTH